MRNDHDSDRIPLRSADSVLMLMPEGYTSKIIAVSVDHRAVSLLFIDGSRAVRRDWSRCVLCPVIASMWPHFFGGVRSVR